MILEIRLLNKQYIRRRILIQDYFVEGSQSLFNSLNNYFPIDLGNLIEPSIARDENFALCGILSYDEIKSILFIISNLKALGPNQLMVIVYKSY